MPVTHFVDPMKESAKSIVERWLEGAITDSEAVCEFVKLILQSKGRRRKHGVKLNH